MFDAVYRPLRGLQEEQQLPILGLTPQALCFRPLRGLGYASAGTSDAVEKVEA